MTEPQKKATRNAGAYDSLRHAIRDGTFPPGTRLRFADLQAHCGMSVTPLREALVRLTAEGFTTLDEHKGYSVASQSLAELRDITSCRKLCEGQALRLSLRNGDAAWEGRLLAAHHVMSKTPQARADIPSAISEDWETAHAAFHSALISACGSPLLLEMCASLFARADRYRRMSVSLTGSGRDTEGEHRTILDHALARNADAAVAALEAHYQATADALEHFFERPASDVMDVE